MALHPVLRYLVGFNGYPFSAVAAVLLHVLLLGFALYWNANSDSSEFELVQPTVIKALFIDENPQLRERQRLERLRFQREEEQDRQREQQRRQAEEERQLAEERQRQEAERQRQAEAEQLRQQQSREQAERRRQEELAEQERRREELAAQERRRQQEAERDRQAEAAAAAAARTEFEVVQSGVALIQQIVQENWSRPPSARNGMRAVLRIGLLPTGEATDVVIVQSSGDPAFDRSAETAVYRAQPFSELRDMPINIFNANFRTLSLIFEPEDLLN